MTINRDRLRACRKCTSLAFFIRKKLFKGIKLRKINRSKLRVVLEIRQCYLKQFEYLTLRPKMGLFGTDKVWSSVRPNLTLKDLVQRPLKQLNTKSVTRQSNLKPFFYTFDNNQATKPQVIEISTPRERYSSSPPCVVKSHSCQYIAQNGLKPPTCEDYSMLSNSSNLSHIVANSRENLTMKKFNNEIIHPSSVPTESELSQMRNCLQFSKHGSVYSNLSFYQKQKSWLDKSFYLDDDKEDIIEHNSSLSIPNSYDIQNTPINSSLISLSEAQPEIVPNPFGRPHGKIEKLSYVPKSVHFSNIYDSEEIRIADNPYQWILDGQSNLIHGQQQVSTTSHFWTEQNPTNNYIGSSLNHCQSEPNLCAYQKQEAEQIQNLNKYRAIFDVNPGHKHSSQDQAIFEARRKLQTDKNLTQKGAITKASLSTIEMSPINPYNSNILLEQITSQAPGLTLNNNISFPQSKHDRFNM